MYLQVQRSSLWDTPWLFTIYMAKPVVSRFGLTKIWNHWSHLPKLGGYQTGIKGGFEEMEHEFLIRTFCPQKLDYLLRWSETRQ